MARFKPGVRVRYSDGVVYRVMPDGSHRREDGGGPGKAERKAAKRNKVHRRDACATNKDQGLKKHKGHRLENDKDHRLEACATGVEKT
jgi:hypothetical protein